MDTPPTEPTEFNFEAEYQKYITGAGKGYTGPDKRGAFMHDFSGNTLGRLLGFLGIVADGMEPMSKYSEKIMENIKRYQNFLKAIPADAIEESSLELFNGLAKRLESSISDLEAGEIDQVKAETIFKSLEQQLADFRSLKFNLMV